MLVNKRELARLLKCAPTTVDAIIDRHGDAFPIVERGSHGRDWQFDPQAVVDFLRGIDEERRRASAERDAEMQQYVLPADGLRDNHPSTLKPRDRLDILKAQQLERQIDREQGLLVETAEVRRVLDGQIRRLDAGLRAAIRQAAREHNLPDAVTRTILHAFTGEQRRFLHGVGKFGSDDDAAGDGTIVDLATVRPTPADVVTTRAEPGPLAGQGDRAGPQLGPRAPG